MSTYYSALPPVRFPELFDGALAPFNVREHVNKHTTTSRRCLTDGNNFLWVSCNDDGFACFTRYAGNAPSQILEAIQDAFDVEVFSEHDPQYWGFATEEEWHAAWTTIAAERQEQFYNDVIRYVRGENHSLLPGTIGMIQADIAKRLIADHPELSLLQSKEKLLQAIEAEYNRHHLVVVTLTAEDQARAKLLATHEDDLPRA